MACSTKREKSSAVRDIERVKNLANGEKGPLLRRRHDLETGGVQDGHRRRHRDRDHQRPTNPTHRRGRRWRGSRHPFLAKGAHERLLAIVVRPVMDLQRRFWISAAARGRPHGRLRQLDSRRKKTPRLLAMADEVIARSIAAILAANDEGSRARARARALAGDDRSPARWIRNALADHGRRHSRGRGAARSRRRSASGNGRRRTDSGSPKSACRSASSASSTNRVRT